MAAAATPMIAASMFAGIGGAELALPEADWRWCAEIEPFPSAVLEQRFGHPNLGDVMADDFIDRALAFGPLDLLCAGPPCQAFSIAGDRLSMADPRGNLSLRFIQVAHAIRPRNLLIENVPGWLNTPDNAFGCFLAAIVGSDGPLPCPLDGGSWPSAGMVAGPEGKVAWRVLDAQYSGLAQRRRRVFAVVDFGEGADPAAVLFERNSLHGDTPPRRETGQGIAHDVAPSLVSSGRGVERAGETRGQDPVVAELVHTFDRQSSGEYGEAPVASTMSARDYKGVSDIIAHTLRGEGFDASEDGTGRGTPLVPVAYRTSGNSGAYATGDTVDALTTGTDQSSHLVAFDTTQITSASNYSNPQPGDPCHPLATSAHVPAVAFDMRGREGGAQFEGPHATANIRAASGGSSRSYVATQWAVRRLTPTECERLQGYPDGHTLIEFGSRRSVAPDMAAYLRAKGVIVEADNRTGKLRTNAAADGPRYKALGNAWAVNCVRPIARKIKTLQEAA